MGKRGAVAAPVAKATPSKKGKDESNKAKGPEPAIVPNPKGAPTTNAAPAVVDLNDVKHTVDRDACSRFVTSMKYHADSIDSKLKTKAMAALEDIFVCVYCKLWCATFF